MENRIKNAIGAVHAEEELRQNTKAFLKEKLYQEKKSFLNNRYAQSKRLMAVAASLAVVLFGGYLTCFQPVSAISIDINPSIELSINRLNKVIEVKGYNEDGIWLAEQLDVHFMDYTEAVDAILGDEIVEEYLERDEELEVTVLGNNDIKSQEMYDSINACVKGHKHKNVHCSTGNREEVHVAHEHGISFGKYNKFLKLQKLDSSIMINDVKGLTMRELNEWIAKLSGEDDKAAFYDSNGYENDSGTGSNYGNSEGIGSGFDSENERHHGKGHH